MVWANYGKIVNNNNKQIICIIIVARSPGHGSGCPCARACTNDAEKAEVFNKYFCAAFGKKEDNIPISHEDDDVLSSPLVTKEDIKQYLLGINSSHRIA